MEKAITISMLLERRLVKILNDYNMCKGLIDRDALVSHVLKTKWLRWNYFDYKNDVFKMAIETTIDDCIAYEFIYNDNKGIHLKVTKGGRDYLKILGFVEEFLKRRKRTIVNTTSFVIGGLVTYLVNYFLSHPNI